MPVLVILCNRINVGNPVQSYQCWLPCTIVSMLVTLCNHMKVGHPAQLHQCSRVIRDFYFTLIPTKAKN